MILVIFEKLITCISHINFISFFEYFIYICFNTFSFSFNILSIHGQCDECDGNYELYTVAYKQNDSYLKCIKCGSKRSILHKYIFTRTKLKPNKVLHLLYC